MPRAGLDSERVVAAAAELADEHGMAAVTLARLARRLGVQSPSLYAHVDGLEDLRRRLCARGARELAAALGAAAAGRARQDALRAVAQTYRDYARAHPGVYAAMQRAPEEGSSEAAAARALVAVIAAALAGYSLSGDGMIHAVRIVRSALHGFVSLEQEGGFRMAVSLPESYERLIAVLDAGLSGIRTG